MKSGGQEDPDDTIPPVAEPTIPPGAFFDEDTSRDWDGFSSDELDED